MNKKEKATALTRVFYRIIYDRLPCISTNELTRLSEQCAIAAIEELIDRDKNGDIQYDDYGDLSYEGSNYWQEVKKEISKVKLL